MLRPRVPSVHVYWSFPVDRQTLAIRPIQRKAMMPITICTTVMSVSSNLANSGNDPRFLSIERDIREQRFFEEFMVDASLWYNSTGNFHFLGLLAENPPASSVSLQLDRRAILPGASQ